MHKLCRLAAALCLSFGGLNTCEKPPANDASQPPTEHIDEEQKAAAAKLQPAKDPAQEAIRAYRLQVRQEYNSRHFDALELPRWYGQKGDWEAYADAAAKRPDGLGAGVYARIVMDLHEYYGNIFRETQASWLLTRDGLAQMREKYPDSLGILSASALLAAQAEDRTLAQKLFEQIGGRYLPEIWRTPEEFVHDRHWAQTGVW